MPFILNITVDGEKLPPRDISPKPGEVVVVGGRYALITLVAPQIDGSLDVQCTYSRRKKEK